MPQQACLRYEKVYHKHDEQRRSPRRYRVARDRKVRVLPKHPDARAHCSGIAAKDKDFEQRVETAWKVAESAREEESRDYRAMLRLEAFEKRDESDRVEEEVEEVLVKERKCVKAVDWIMSVHCLKRWTGETNVLQDRFPAV
ncbi:hypothetical protein LTR95_000714 [Oleoguttula sp. CCFEE 5521]